MLQAVRWELKKIGKNKFLWGLLVFFLLADSYKMAHTYFGINDRTRGEQEIYQELKGTITDKKIHFLVQNMEYYSQLVESGEYSTKGNQKGTYSGYIMGDYHIFSSYYEKMKTAYAYKKYAAKICQKAKQNAQMAKSRKNSYEWKKNNMIYHTFWGREIKQYYDSQVSKAMFSYDFSTIFMILSIITAVGSVLELDQAHHMSEILATVPFGNRRRACAKLWSIALFSAVVVGIFVIWDAGMLQVQYGWIENWRDPVYSMEGYENSPLRCSILAFFALWVMQRYLVVLFFAFLTFILYQICLNQVRTVACSIGLYVMCIGICIKTNWYLNPVLLFQIQERMKETTIVNWFGIPFYEYEIRTLFMLIGIGMAGAFVIFTGAGWKGIRVRKKDGLKKGKQGK